MATRTLPAALIPSDVASNRAATTVPAVVLTPARPLWRRLFDAFIAAQMRRAEREVARHMRLHNLRFTDDR